LLKSEENNQKEEAILKIKSMLDRWSMKDKEKLRRRLYNYLKRRGFSHSFIVDVLKEVLET